MLRAHVGLLLKENMVQGLEILIFLSKTRPLEKRNWLEDSNNNWIIPLDYSIGILCTFYCIFNAET